MRILGFSKIWDKLGNNEFTTFRFTRGDKDWYVGEQVRVVFKPRSKKRLVLGIAQIMNKEPKKMWNWQPDEMAWKDGFTSMFFMRLWLERVYGDRWQKEPMNCLTLRWIEKE